MFGVKVRLEQMEKKNEPISEERKISQKRVNQDKFEQTTYFAYDLITVFDVVGKGKMLIHKFSNSIGGFGTVRLARVD